MSSPDDASAPPPSMFAAPHRNVSAGARALQDGAPISSEPVPPVGVSLNGASTLANASSPQGGTDDRQWVLLGGNDGHTPTRAVQALPEPLKQTEADLAEMRVRSLLEENQRLRDALRMDQKKAESAHVERDLAHTQALMGQIQELKELNQSQRDEINRMQVDYDAIAVKLSKAEANVDRKIEMIQILRTQLDDSDQKASAKGSEAASSNAERMKAQERLMQLTEQMKDLKMELDNERKLKENAWERLLHVDHGQVEDLQSKLADEQSKLADERMNAREILDEMRTLRAEKDALTQTMTEERNNLRAEIATLSANKDFMHDEREQALEKLQILREENSQLNAHNAQLDAQISRLSTQVTSAQKDNEALKGQLNFLTQELHARQNELAEFVNSNIQMVSRAQLHAEPSDIRPFELRVEPTDHDEQARFFEQQILNQQQSPPFPGAQAQQQSMKPHFGPQQVFAPENLSEHMPLQQMQMQSMQPLHSLPQKHVPMVQVQSMPGKPMQMVRIQQPVTPQGQRVQMHQANGTPKQMVQVMSQMQPIQQSPHMTPQPGPQRAFQPSQMQGRLTQHMSPQFQGTPQPQVAAHEMTPQQVLQAGFDPNSIIGV